MSEPTTEQEEEQDSTPLEDVVELLRDERRRWRMRFAGIAIVVFIGVVAFVRMGAAVTEAKEAAATAQTAIDLSNAQKVEARLSACLAYNRDLTANINALNDKIQNTLLNSAASGGRSTADQARADRFVQLELRGYEDVKVPLRDCSPEGIDAFYANEGGIIPPQDATTTTSTTTAPPASSTTTRARRSTTTTARPAPTSTTPTTVRRSTTTTLPPCATLPVPVSVPCV